MTEQDIKDILHIPFKRLAELCQDTEILIAVINTTYQQGINLGQRKTHKEYNELFKGYNEISINN